MSSTPETLLRQHHAWKPKTDKHEYQWKLRLLQSLWRADNGLPYRVDGNEALGTQLPMPEAQHTLANFLTPEIREDVRREVLDRERSRGKVYVKPRIFNNLLSSQPLCFNLFAELRNDLPLASRAFAQLTRGRLSEVTAIEFEWSPGRGDERYTGDGTAFDVYIRYRDVDDLTGFLGIEVKYRETLPWEPREYRERYSEVAKMMACFHGDARRLGPKSSLRELWRNHLLVGAHKIVDGFDAGAFVLLYPEVNTVYAAAACEYRNCLKRDQTSFIAWTIDALAASLMSYSDARWIRQFYKRYLELGRLPPH